MWVGWWGVYVYTHTKVWPVKNGTYGVSFCTCGLIITPFSCPQETCQYLKDYLTRLLVPYVVNVSWATQYCSTARCHDHGRCLRRNPNANTFLHLSASSFRLVPGREPGEPQLRPEGELSRADLDHLQKHFRCQCYLGWGGERCQQDNRRVAGGAAEVWAGSYLSSLLALAVLVLPWTL